MYKRQEIIQKERQLIGALNPERERIQRQRWTDTQREDTLRQQKRIRNRENTTTSKRKIRKAMIKKEGGEMSRDTTTPGKNREQLSIQKAREKNE